MKRKYSVEEIDDLRDVVEHKWLFGSYRHSKSRRVSRRYNDEEKAIAVEQMVRTHMLAGHVADDLLASETRV